MSNSSGGDRPMSLCDIADKLHDGEFGERLEVEEVLETFGRRSYGPLLLTPSLVAVLPGLGALPGVSWAMAALVVLISLQFVTVRRKLWVPKALRDASLSHEMVRNALNRAKPWLQRLDRIFKPRLEILLNRASTWLIALVCLALGVAMFVFSIVPGGIVIPALAVLLLAIGLTTHDGFVLLLGLIAAAANVWAIWWLFF